MATLLQEPLTRCCQVHRLRAVSRILEPHPARGIAHRLLEGHQREVGIGRRVVVGRLRREGVQEARLRSGRGPVLARS